MSQISSIGSVLQLGHWEIWCFRRVKKISNLCFFSYFLQKIFKSLLKFYNLSLFFVDLNHPFGFKTASQWQPSAEQKRKVLLQPPGFPEVPGLSASSLGDVLSGMDSCLHRGWGKVSDRLKISHRKHSLGSWESLAHWSMQGAISWQEHLFWLPLLWKEPEWLLFIAVEEGHFQGCHGEVEQALGNSTLDTIALLCDGLSSFWEK